MVIDYHQFGTKKNKYIFDEPSLQPQPQLSNLFTDLQDNDVSLKFARKRISTSVDTVETAVICIFASLQ